MGLSKLYKVWKTLLPQSEEKDNDENECCCRSTLWLRDMANDQRGRIQTRRFPTLMLEEEHDRLLVDGGRQ